MTHEPIWRRYQRLLRPNVIADVDDEIEFHIEARVAEYVAAGMNPSVARKRAVEEFGDMERAKQLCRKIDEQRQRRRGLAEYVDTVRQDMKYAARMLARSPGFTVAAVCTLALGIGANAAIFSLVNAVLLRPLPFRAPERLVRVWERSPAGDERNVVSAGNYHDWRTRARSFTTLAAHSWSYGLAMTEHGDPVMVTQVEVTPSLFPMLGVSPALGRGFTDEDVQANDVVLLSDGFWRSRFGADRGVLGRRIVLNDRPYTVVGVMPPRFDFPVAEVEVWRLASATRLAPGERRGHNWFVVGRLAPGVSLEQTRAEMRSIGAALTREYPEFMTGWGINVFPLHDDIVASVRPVLLVLLVGVGVILLIACANIANLLLARAVTREREMALRGALGAMRARLVRQLLTEGLALAAVGGLLGLAIATPLLRALIALAPSDIPLLETVSLDRTVLAFGVGATILSTALFALAPALRLARTDLHSMLRASQGSAGGIRHARLRNALLVGEVALSLVLLVGAGLLLQSARRLNAVDYGFRADGLLSVYLDLPRSRYDSTAKQLLFYNQLLERIRTVPGVAGTAGSSELPAAGNNMTFSYAIEEQPSASPSGRQDAQALHVVTTDYFRVLGVKIVRGRVFDGRDNVNSPPVLVVNEAFARRHWPGESAVGKRLSFRSREGPWLEIVGVVGDTRMLSADAPPAPIFYVPYEQKQWYWLGWMAVLVRAKHGIDPLALAPAIRRAVAEQDPRLPIHRIDAVSTLYGESTARRRFATTLLTAFAALALGLGIVGMYGVLSYAVAQRRREFGIRIALGASTTEVMASVLRQALALTAIGVVIGTAGALALTRLLGALLYEVSPTDPITYIVVALLLTMVAAVAAWTPAWRATRIDPLVVLREA